MKYKAPYALGLSIQILLSVLNLAKAEDIAHYPFPQHVHYAPDTIKPNHTSQAKLDEHVRAYYDQWKAEYLIKDSKSKDKNVLYRIRSFQPNDTSSEGQGYGMIFIALMAGYDKEAQSIFDGLYRFARQHHSRGDLRLMSWEYLQGENKLSDSAFDGDADIAYSLLLADKQWGSDGAVNYRNAAQAMITAIAESTIGWDSYLPLLSDVVTPDDVEPNQYTPRSSDFMPAHFKAFGRFTGSPIWPKVVSHSQGVIDVIQSQYSLKTGLLPDFITYNHPARPHFLEGIHDGDFSYNAGRVPLRLGLDVLLNDDAISRKQVQKMSTWLRESTHGDPALIKPGYKLDGTWYSDYYSAFFVAPFGVAAMLDKNHPEWLIALYETIYATHQDYYADSITLFCLLVMTGNYWDPTTIE